MGVDNVDSDDRNDEGEVVEPISDALRKKLAMKFFNSRMHPEWLQSFADDLRKQVDLCREWQLSFNSFFQLGSTPVGGFLYSL